MTPSIAGRRAALAAIGLAVAALTVPRLTTEAELSVPVGAAAGDLALQSCTYPTNGGDRDADCGTLVVPENRNDPDSRLIALPVVRIRATGSDSGTPIFFLEGGPGQSNLDFPVADRIADRHDVVLVGYRGVDGSSVLDCPEVTGVLQASVDLAGEETQRREAEAFGRCRQRLADEDVDLAGYSLPQRVEDLEAARTALDYDRINLISESAGTRTAMLYSWIHPESLNRSVMIAANPPGHFVWDPELTDRRIGRYAELCALDGSCSARTSDLATTFRQVVDDLPERWWFLPVKEGNVRAATMTGLFNTNRGAAPLNAAAIVDSLLSAAEGDAAGLWLLSTLSDLVFPRGYVWGEAAASATIDDDASRAFYDGGGDPGSVLGSAAADMLWAGGRLGDVWPTSPDHDGHRQVRRSAVETLIISGTLDPSVPFELASEELLPALPNGRQVVLADMGHTSDFWAYQPDAANHLLNGFFDRGEVDVSRYTTQEITFDAGRLTLSTLARILVLTLSGLVVLAAGVLGSVAWRVHRAGGIGPRASVVLGTVGPVPVGLGAWAAGLLVTLAFRPAAHVGGTLVTIGPMSVAVGVLCFLTWTGLHRSVGARTLGSVVAVTTALVGAWYGFGAIDGPGALLTSLVGAIAGANLGLLLIDRPLGGSRRQRTGRIHTDPLNERVRVARRGPGHHRGTPPTTHA